jgi:hypothetical protein
MLVLLQIRLIGLGGLGGPFIIEDVFYTFSHVLDNISLVCG